MGGRGDRSATEHVVVEDVEEVVELQGHLQSLSHVTLTSSETSKRQSTYRPRTHKKTAGSISHTHTHPHTHAHRPAEMLLMALMSMLMETRMQLMMRSPYAAERVSCK